MRASSLQVENIIKWISYSQQQSLKSKNSCSVDQSPRLFLEIESRRSLVSLGERAVSVGGCGVSVVHGRGVGRGGVSTVSAVGGDARHVGNVGSAADQQVSAALDMRGLGGVSVDNRSRVVSVSAVVGSRCVVGRGRGVVSRSVVGRGRGVVRLGGRLVLGRGGVIAHGTDDDDGEDDCCYDGVHDDEVGWWWFGGS
uniref:Uncharacterized protein n=1 Tax=Anopheles coluzzii TaxID=1518534 RepID=A0A8W7PBT6_ANOCL